MKARYLLYFAMYGLFQGFYYASIIARIKGV